MKRGFVLLPLALLLGACTASIAGQQSGYEPVSVILPEGASVDVLSEEYPIDENNEDPVEIGEDVSGVEIGRDATCVLVNQSWFLVNKLALPGSSSEIKPEWLFVPEDLEEEWPNGTGGEDAPARIDSALLPWRTVNNLGTESQWVVLEDTCIPHTVKVSGKAPESFINFLQTPAGQDVLARAGIAFPLEGEGPEEVSRIVTLPQSE